MKQIAHPAQWASLACLLLACGLAPVASRATEHDVDISETGFDPNYLEVHLGDDVVWGNFDFSGADHSTHSTTYPWNSGPVSQFETVSLTVTKTGTFSYQDDFTGHTATLVILPTPPVLTNGTRLQNGNFQITVTNLVAGKTNILQASTNLVNWTNLYTNVSSTGFTYTDSSSAALKRRFYRAWVLP